MCRSLPTPKCVCVCFLNTFTMCTVFFFSSARSPRQDPKASLCLPAKNTSASPRVPWRQGTAKCHLDNLHSGERRTWRGAGGWEWGVTRSERVSTVGNSKLNDMKTRLMECKTRQTLSVKCSKSGLAASHATRPAIFSQIHFFNYKS